METEEERRARLENDAGTKRLRLAMETEEERKARLEKMVHCKNCGVLCPPNEQHTIGGISHQPLKVCLAHLIWCARS